MHTYLAHAAPLGAGRAVFRTFSSERRTLTRPAARRGSERQVFREGSRRIVSDPGTTCHRNTSMISRAETSNPGGILGELPLESEQEARRRTYRRADFSRGKANVFGGGAPATSNGKFPISRTNLIKTGQRGGERAPSSSQLRSICSRLSGRNRDHPLPSIRRPEMISL